MKKILVVTPRFLYPVIGGDRLRIYEICKSLSRNYQLTLISLCESEHELHLPIPEDGVFANVERILLPRWRSYLNCAFALLTRKPLQVAYYQSKELTGRINALVEEHDFGLCHLIRTAEYLAYLNIPKMLEMTDAISLNYSRVAKIAKTGGIKNLIYALEQKRLNSYERNIGKYFENCVLVSDVDKNYLFSPEQSIFEKVLVCSNGVDTDSLPFAEPSSSKVIIFIGNLHSVQNLDGALWFAQKVMPKLYKVGYRFKVIGQIRDRDKQKFGQLAGVELTGSVESVAEEARGAMIGVCPVRLGAGIQNKILEYMALGIPCISTPIGHEGLDARENKDLLIANDEHAFVKQIEKLENNPDIQLSLSKNGRAYVENHHSWEVKLQPLVEAFKEYSSAKFYR